MGMVWQLRERRFLIPHWPYRSTPGRDSDLEFLAEELFCLCHLSVPFCELLKRKEILYALTNLDALLLYLGDDVGSGCVWMVLNALCDPFSRLSQSRLEPLHLLLG